SEPLDLLGRQPGHGPVFVGGQRRGHIRVRGQNLLHLAGDDAVTVAPQGDEARLLQALHHVRGRRAVQHRIAGEHRRVQGTLPLQGGHDRFQRGQVSVHVRENGDSQSTASRHYKIASPAIKTPTRKKRKPRPSKVGTSTATAARVVDIRYISRTAMTTSTSCHTPPATPAAAPMTS